ncbi:MAG: hypothetical protein HQL40_19430 [Alphaproteobacteria bacterium]|nr:hypothetical protein [Alphaproteobacteria bacterium]
MIAFLSVLLVLVLLALLGVLATGVFVFAKGLGAGGRHALPDHLASGGPRLDGGSGIGGA